MLLPPSALPRLAVFVSIQAEIEVARSFLAAAAAVNTRNVQAQDRVSSARDRRAASRSSFARCRSRSSQAEATGRPGSSLLASLSSRPIHSCIHSRYGSRTYATQSTSNIESDLIPLPRLAYPHEPSSLHGLSRSLVSHIDRTSVLPRASSLQDVFPDNGQSVRFYGFLKKSGVSEWEWLLWRDLLSTWTLADAMGRLEQAVASRAITSDSRPSGTRVDLHANDSTIYLPPFIIRRLSSKPSTRSSLLSLIRNTSTYISFMPRTDALDIYTRFIRLCGEKKMWVVIGGLVKGSLQLYDTGLKESSETGEDEEAKGREGSRAEHVAAKWAIQYANDQESEMPPLLALVKVCEATFPRPQSPEAKQARNQLYLYVDAMLKRELDSDSEVKADSSQPKSYGAGLPKTLMNVLFNSACLSPNLISLLEDHLERHGIPFKGKWKRACFATLVHEPQKGASKDARSHFDGFSEHVDVDQDIIRDRTVYGVVSLAGKESRTGELRRLMSLGNQISASPENSEERKQLSRKASSRVWAEMIQVVGQDSKISDQVYIDLVDSMPKRYRNLVILTSIMHGYVTRGLSEEALRIWKDEVLGTEGLQPDVKALTVAVQATLSAVGLEQAIRLVDSWAIRAGKSGASTVGSGRHSKIQIDSDTINILLEGCNRSKQPNLAYRLWQVMLPRWGVEPDSATVASLLHCADFGSRRFQGSDADLPVEGQGGARSFREFIEEIKESFRSVGSDTKRDRFGRQSGGARKVVDSEAERYANSGLAQGSIGGLLESAIQSRSSGRLLDWMKGKDIFESILFGNAPDLLDIEAPFAMMKPPSSALSLPINANYCHLILSVEAFHAYIIMLGNRRLVPQTLMALTYMRALGIIPESRTMARVLSYVDEETTPLMESAREWQDKTGKSLRLGIGFLNLDVDVGIGENEKLRRWLGEWVPLEEIPTRKQVEQFIKRSIWSKSQ